MSEAHGIAEDRVEHLGLVLNQDLAVGLIGVDPISEVHGSLEIVVGVGDAGIALIAVDVFVVGLRADVGDLVGIRIPLNSSGVPRWV